MNLMTNSAVSGEATPFLFHDYQFKPAYVEAVCYDDPAKAQAIIDIVGGVIVTGIWKSEPPRPDATDTAILEATFVPQNPPFLLVPTQDGEKPVRLGDYIVRGLTGHYWVCGPERFTMTYQARHQVIIAEVGNYTEDGTLTLTKTTQIMGTLSSDLANALTRA